MRLWESEEIYLMIGFSLFVTLGVITSLAYFTYKRVVTSGRRANEEQQAALEKVLLRRESTSATSGPPTKPLIVSPSFSSPNKVSARHLRSGSYSPNHFLSPYHNRQPRRNSSPSSSNLQLPIPSKQTNTCSHLQSEISTKEIKEEDILRMNHQQQYYGTIASSQSSFVPKISGKGNYTQLCGKNNYFSILEEEQNQVTKEDNLKSTANVSENVKKVCKYQDTEENLQKMKQNLSKIDSKEDKLNLFKQEIQQEIPYYTSSE